MKWVIVLVSTVTLISIPGTSAFSSPTLTACGSERRPCAAKKSGLNESIFLWRSLQQPLNSGADRNVPQLPVVVSTTKHFGHVSTFGNSEMDELDVDGRISSWSRLVNALPKIRYGVSESGATSIRNLRLGDDLDRQILGTAVPSMVNLAVVPLVNSVDTFWVGKMGVALSLAGQAAANQAFGTIFFLVAFLPTITAPLVAKALGSGDTEEAQSRVCEALFLSNVLGGLGTLLLVGFPRVGLRMVLQSNAPAIEYAAPYLRLRALSMVPALISATGFAAYRGLLNTVTPLKISLLTNLLNLVLDPLFIFGLSVKALQRYGLGLYGGGIGFVGAALATAASETLSGIIYLKLLLRRKLVRWSRLIRPPSWNSLRPLIEGGLAMLSRQTTLNLAFLAAARRAQVMDPTGVSAAAYGIVMQIYMLGIVVHLAIQTTSATLVPSAKGLGGNDAARDVADRMFLWGTIVGVILGVTQLVALPIIVPLFSTLPEVQQAVKVPALISSFIHIINGPVFAGEGCMLGLERFRALAFVTALGVAVMGGCLASPLGKRLDGILLSIAAFCLFQAIGVIVYHVRIGPLRRRNFRFFDSGT